MEKSTGEVRPAPGRYLFNIFFASFGFVALRFILSPVRIKILSSLLSKEDYGILTLVSLTISFVTLVSSLGSLEFLLRKLPGRDDRYQFTMFKTIATRFGALGVAIAAVGAVWLVLRPPAELHLDTADAVACGLLLVLTVHLTQVVYYLLGRTEYAHSRIIALLYADTWFLLTIAFEQKWVNLRNIWHAPATREALKEVLMFGLPLMPMIFGEWLFRVQDRYVLLALRDLKAVANYGLCISLALVGATVGSAVLDILLAEFFKIRNPLRTHDLDQLSSHGDLRKVFTMMIRYSVIVLVPIVAALCLAGPQLIRFLSDPKFLDAAGILPWTAPIPLLACWILIFGRTLMSLNRGAVVGWSTLLAAVVNIGLNLLFVPILGERGAALANSLSYAVLTGYMAWAVRAWRWVDVRDLMPVRLVILAALTAAGFYVARFVLHAGTFAVLAAGGGWGLVCTFLLGLLRKADLNLLVPPMQRPAPADAIETDEKVLP
jgi:O-antigen/teichoic acid export membrane protein